MVELTPDEEAAIAHRAALDSHFDQMIRDGQKALDIPEHERINDRRRNA